MERAEEAAPTSPRPTKREPTRLLVIALAALFIFPFLAQSGIWDPYELDAADLMARL